MNNTQLIRFDKLKMGALQAVSAFLFALCMPWVIGIPVPVPTRLTFAVLAAVMFGGISPIFSAYLLASRLDGEHIENLFPALGRGRVNLNSARLVKFPSFLTFRLIDEKSKGSARLPRPFWSENPEVVAKILQRVESIKNVCCKG